MENTKKEIKLIKFIEIRYADPITAIDLTDDYLLFGSMLGATNYFIINSQELVTLSENQEEYVSGAKINENSLYLCIGDFKILIYTINSDNSDNNNPTEIDNYVSEKMHQDFCERCLTILSDNFLIRTFDNSEEKKKSKLKKFRIKNINKYLDEEIIAETEMSNYCVPFDFDGKNFIFIDFVDEKKRNLRIFNIGSKNVTLNYELEKKSGEEQKWHISHLKIVKENLLFIVRNYNICELRNFKFDLIKKLNIKAKEILAFDILFEDGDSRETNVIDNIINTNLDNNKNNDSINNINNINSEKQILYIVILDIDCNIFLYDFKADKNELLLNLEKDEIGINKDIKNQKFFIFGYPYYIKISKKYITITSDYGCILLQYTSGETNI